MSEVGKLAVPGGVQLLTNADFEQGTGGWVKYGGGTFTTTTPGRSGSGNAAKTTGWTYAEQTLPYAYVSAGTSYTLEAYAKSPNGANCRAGVAGGGSGGDFDYPLLTFNTSAWEKKSAQVTLPSGATWAVVYVLSDVAANQECQYDDLLFYTGTLSDPGTPPATSNNILNNPGFEQDLLHWNTSTGSPVINPQGRTGKAVQFNAWSWIEQGLDNTQFQAGQTYVMKGWMRSTNNEACTIGLLGGNDNEVTFDKSYSFYSSSWVEKYVTQALPSDTTWILPYLSGAQGCQFDDLVLGIASAPANEQYIEFIDSEVQAVWDEVNALPNLDLYRLTPVQSEGIGMRSGDLTGLVIPVSTDEYKYLLAGAEGDKLQQTILFSFRPEEDNLTLTNIIDSRSVTIENLSQYLPLTPERENALASLIYPVVGNKAFDPARFGSSGGQVRAAANCAANDCRTKLAEYNNRAMEYARGLVPFVPYFPVPGYWGYMIPGCPLPPAAKGTLRGPVRTCAWNTAVIIKENIIDAGRALEGFNNLMECFRQNNPSYATGDTLIAFTSIPLPYTFQVFVQSIPDRVNLASGNLPPSSSTATVRSLLESAVDNAIFVFEEYSSRLVVPGSAHVDPATRSISATFETLSPPPICAP